MKNFFEKIDFTFGDEASDIKPSKIIISENLELTEKLANYVYLFDSPSQTNSSFYVITIPLADQDLFELRRFIWNENKYDLYFLAETPTITKLCYAKTNPREPEIKIESFNLTEDSNELEKIKKWKFDSGAFWLSYKNILDKIKKVKRIDTALIEQLKDLKGQLQNELKNIDSDSNKVIQALIDRTLFIKFLEDNHIINLDFYDYHFETKGDISFCYKTLLENYDTDGVNKLFSEINNIFNNELFKTPSIKEECLNNNVLDSIYKAITQYDWKTGQLSLFDFKFDVIPTEFISHIYEVFLEDKQRKDGIYYTPNKLVDLIIDETITDLGTVLDPACGSGIFLVLAFRKILKGNPNEQNISVCEKIAHRSKLLKKYIYGIEKEETAWRLAIFSLYLEILKNFSTEEIEEFVKQELENNFSLKIFPDDFSNNIRRCNSLEVEAGKIPHENKTFDYIVGNPPYHPINPYSEEISFIYNYSTEIDTKTIKAREIIGYNQISQAFMLKIKDWAKSETRFGFVLDSSSFYNEKSREFQNFFFEYYQVENFYELSRVKKILFREATESVVVVIFNNKKEEDNRISYYPVDMEIFSETFDLLIIKEDKKIDILQKDINNKVILRNYLIGNSFDLSLIDKIKNTSICLSEYAVKSATKDKPFIHEGLKIVGQKAITRHFKIDDKEWRKFDRAEQKKLFSEFRNIFTSKVQTNSFNIEYFEPKNISCFQVIGKTEFIGDISTFERPRDENIYTGNKILWNRTGNQIKACYIKEKVYFNFDIHVIKIKDDSFNYLFTAIFNSYLVNYYLNIVKRKRIDSSFPKISNDDFQDIPVPKILDEDLVSEISEISRQLTEGKLKYEGKTKEELNDLIFDLYDLGYLDKQRIKEYFSTKDKVDAIDLENYKIALLETLEIYFKTKPEIKYYQDKAFGFNIIVTVVYFNDSYKNVFSSEDVFKYIISKILQESNEKFLAMREKIVGKDCIYIIRDNKYKSWSISKAFEDGKEILRLFGL